MIGTLAPRREQARRLARRTPEAASPLLARLRRRPVVLAWIMHLLAALGWGASAGAAVPSQAPPLRHYLTADVSTAPLAAYRPPSYLLAPRDLPTVWRPTPLPHVALRSSHPSPALIETWYRLRYVARPSLDALYLYAPHWQVTGRLAIYADRRLVYAPRSGPEWTSFNLPVWVKLADRGSPAPSEILFDIQSQKSNGGGLSTVWIGSETDLGLMHGLRYWAQINSVIAFSYMEGLLGVVAFGIWVRRRKEKALLYLALATFFNIVWSTEFETGESAQVIRADWFGWLLLVGLRGWIVSSYLFALEILGARAPRLKATLIAIGGGLFLLTMPVFGPGSILASSDLSPLVDDLTLLGVAVMTVMLWMYYIKRPSHEGLVICLYSSLWPIAGFHDVLFENYRISIESMAYTPLIFGLIPLAMVYIMTRRYFIATQELDEQASRLASRVRTRERELEESHARLRQLERQDAIAVERQRLMRDMHDGMGSVLIGALAAVERGQLREADVAQLLRECVDDLKLTIDAMETAEADLPLVLATLRYRLGPRFERAGVRLVWQVGPTPPLAHFDAEQALHLMRMVQEIFTNVIKHAGASRVVVSTIQRSPGELVLNIEDDGVGFSAASLGRSAGRGLANLRHRAAAIGASISWTSHPGRTCYTLALPVAAPAAAPASPQG